MAVSTLVRVLPSTTLAFERSCEFSFYFDLKVTMYACLLMIKTSLLNDFLKLRYIFSSKAFIFRKKPAWATCQIDWGWCGFHRTSCHPVCYIPVNHVCSLKYFQTSIAIFLVIFNGFEVICWLLAGQWPWYSLRLLRYDLKLVKQMPGNAIFSRSLLPSVPVLKIHQ